MRAASFVDTSLVVDVRVGDICVALVACSIRFELAATSRAAVVSAISLPAVCETKGMMQPVCNGFITSGNAATPATDVTDGG